MMRFHRHRHLTLTMALALLVSMTAGIAGGPVTQAQDKAPVSLWLDTTGGAETANCTIENVIDPFNEQSDTAEVTATLQANSWDATRTALAGGAGPDIVTTPGPSFVFELAKAGELLPLDDYVTQLGWDKSFVPWALDLGKVNGKLYSNPDEIETLVLYYNTALFEKKGWKLPRQWTS